MLDISSPIFESLRVVYKFCLPEIPAIARGTGLFIFVPPPPYAELRLLLEVPRRLGSSEHQNFVGGRVLKVMSIVELAYSRVGTIGDS